MHALLNGKITLSSEQNQYSSWTWHASRCLKIPDVYIRVIHVDLATEYPPPPPHTHTHKYQTWSAIENLKVNPLNFRGYYTYCQTKHHKHCTVCGEYVRVFRRILTINSDYLHMQHSQNSLTNGRAFWPSRWMSVCTYQLSCSNSVTNTLNVNTQKWLHV